MSNPSAARTTDSSGTATPEPAPAPTPDPAARQSEGGGPRRLATLAVAAIGVVFGDIGTSPLYTLKECFHGPHQIAVGEQNVLGVLSLVFWSLCVAVSFKYVSFILRADNRGEGGIFSLFALLPRRGAGMKGAAIAALAGAALLYGDGVITPAISVLSAVEGLEVATDAAASLVVPITCLVLLALFSVQSQGTAGIGRAFGPIMLVWFIALAGLGTAAILRTPRVLLAVNPWHAVSFFGRHGTGAFVVLGSVILAITGAEALYADLGHFGRRPIRLGWFGLAFPALLLNYFGQGALLLERPEAAAHPFYALVPRALLLPMVGLATAATVIASQAVISGVFSVTRQAVQLGYLPRVHIIHTSGETEGQIYIPTINRLLAFACIALVLEFRESGRLAAAYGIAVTGTMVLTSLLYGIVARRTWGWQRRRIAALVGLFLVFDLAFFGSTLLKFSHGGWLPLALGGAMLAVMITWRDGRALLARQMTERSLPLSMFIEQVGQHGPVRVRGTAVFMSSSPDATPSALMHHFKHNQVLHQQIVVLSILSSERPYVAPEERIATEDLGEGFYRLKASYGFMESPNVPEAMRLAAARGLKADAATTSFFLGRETMLTSGRQTMAPWRKTLFAFLSRNAEPATAWFGLPPGRVVELGMQIEL